MYLNINTITSMIVIPLLHLTLEPSMKKRNVYFQTKSSNIMKYKKLKNKIKEGQNLRTVLGAVL